MADELKDALGADVELVASGGGVFEVSRDGELRFSKRKLGRFPEPGEVLDTLRPD